jgi:hypothetical protein
VAGAMLSNVGLMGMTPLCVKRWRFVNSPINQVTSCQRLPTSALDVERIRTDARIMPLIRLLA